MAGLLQKWFTDEDEARNYLERIIWKDGVVCPHCGIVDEAYRLTSDGDSSKKTHVRKGVWKCGACRKQFTVTIGTIFEDSHIALHKWVYAIHLMCSSKKGISAHQLMRNLEIGSYRTAWFMAHRIRWAMTQEPMAAMLGGIGATVEGDECYVGGREKKRGIPGLDSKKTPVVSLVQRGGDVRSFHVQRVTVENIKPILKEHVDPNTHFVTDENVVYHFTRDTMPDHRTVNHGKKEYVRREGDFKVTTNTVEGFFAILKRGNYGIYHHWSRKYMTQYLREFDARYNMRRMEDHQRTAQIIRQSSGKRPMLKNPKRVQPS